MKNNTSLTRKICLMGILAAITVVLALCGTFRVGTQMKISLKFISIFVSGAVLGPVPASIIAGVSDMANAFIMPVGPWLWQITLTELLVGLIFGIFFKNAKNNAFFYLRAFLCSVLQAMLSLFVVTWVLVKLGIMPVYKAAVIVRLPQAVLIFAVYFVVMGLLKKFIFVLKSKEGSYNEKL